MAAPPDYYAMLGVRPNADQATIRATYRALMFRFHPDRNPSRDAEQRARVINEAYAVLSDPEQRRRYDAQRAMQVHARAKARPWRPPPPAQNRMPVRRNFGWLTHPSPRAKKRFAGVVATLGAIMLVRMAWLGLAPASLLPSPAAARDSGFGISSHVADADQMETRAMAMLPEIAFNDIENAATHYAAASSKGGFAAARDYSQACHKALDHAPSWSAADRCAAFDYAASSFSDAQASVSNRAPDAYFSFTQINPGGLYRALSTDALAIDERLAQIRQAVIPVAMQAVWPDAPRSEDMRPITPAVSLPRPAPGIPPIAIPRIALGSAPARVHARPMAVPAFRPPSEDAPAAIDGAPDAPATPDLSNGEDSHEPM